MNVVATAVFAGALAVGILPVRSAEAQDQGAQVYQQYELGTCGDDPAICTIAFGRVGANRRREISHVSCHARTEPDGDIVSASMEILFGPGIVARYYFVPKRIHGGNFVMSLPGVFIPVAAERRPQVIIESTHPIQAAECTVSGHTIVNQ